MRHNVFLSVIATAFLMAGCIVQSQAPTLAPQRIIVVDNSMIPQLINKIAATGQTISVSGFAQINPDCTTQENTRIRITQEPLHGKVKIVRHKQYPHFPPANPNSVCNTKPIEGPSVDYTSNEGFVGSDFIVVDTFINGSQIQQKISVEVK